MRRNGILNLFWASISVCLAFGGFALYMALGNSPPRPAGSGIAGYTLGIGDLLLVLACTAYWIRKYKAASPSETTPEGATERPSTALCQAQEKLADLQAQAARSEKQTLFTLRAAAKRILRETGLRSTHQVVVRRDATGKIYLRLLPREPMNALVNWLIAHQYLGTVSLLLAGMHCGFWAYSPVGAATLLLLTVVVLSGFYGIMIYRKIPPRLMEVEAALREGRPADTQERERYERALRTWMYVHTPLTVSLLILIAVHILSIIYY